MAQQQQQPLHQVTPLVPAPLLARKNGVKHIYFKLDALQPGGSFKIRGIGHHITKQLEAHPHLRIVVSSSGGNAGMAATVAGTALNLEVLVFVPSSTPLMMTTRLRAAGAQVIVAGTVWDEAHAAALLYVAERGADTAMIVHPFEGEALWEGHSSMVDEIADQLPTGVVPDAVICVVGGGGLLSGVVQGLERCYSGGNKKPTVVAVETEGAASLAAAFAAGRPVPLAGGITSIAKSLGAVQISSQPLVLRDRYGADKVRSHVVTDAQAVAAVMAFSDEFRILVEPSCGAGLALVYSQGELVKALPELGPDSVVVVVACGGGMVTLELIDTWRKMFGL
ncbi:pyridoxal-5'-phosphate-dependent protein beta subunit [Powellomyces hirtus]|nr:pyridoxal-5'-phosphate-dependent protein beta subunit [Powellomyces hirtus]